MASKKTDFTERRLRSRTVYRGRLLHVLEDDVRLAGGRMARREYVRHPGAVAMVPFLDPRTVVVELNREIVRRPRLGETMLAAGDAVELVHFVGGG